MRVKCVRPFIGINPYTGMPHGYPVPRVGGIYTICGATDFGYQLVEVPPCAHDKTKFRPVTTDDFQFEDIDKILKSAQTPCNTANAAIAIQKQGGSVSNGRLPHPLAAGGKMIKYCQSDSGVME